MTKTELIDKVIQGIVYDIEMEDFTAISELLEFIPTENLKGYLPEEEEEEEEEGGLFDDDDPRIWGADC